MGSIHGHPLKTANNFPNLGVIDFCNRNPSVRKGFNIGLGFDSSIRKVNVIDSKSELYSASFSYPYSHNSCETSCLCIPYTLMGQVLLCMVCGPVHKCHEDTSSIGTSFSNRSSAIAQDLLDIPKYLLAKASYVGQLVFESISQQQETARR